MSANLQRSSRPMIVTFAVILISIGMTTRIFHVFSSAHVEKPAFYLALMTVVSIPYLIIWFIFLGKNWARWVFLVVFGFGLLSSLARVHQWGSLPVREIVVYCVQALLCAVAAVALLSTTAVDWFRGK